jgi:hypothetical protein
MTGAEEHRTETRSERGDESRPPSAAEGAGHACGEEHDRADRQRRKETESKQRVPEQLTPETTITRLLDKPFHVRTTARRQTQRAPNALRLRLCTSDLPVTRSDCVSIRSLLCAGTFVVGANLGEAVPSDVSVGVTVAKATVGRG